MPRPRRDYSWRELNNAFENKLGVPFRSGKHRSGSYRLPDGDRLFNVTLPQQHRRGISRGLQRDLVRKTRLSPDEFDDLVRCPMTGPQFEARARELFAPD